MANAYVDQYSLCFEDYISQIRSLSKDYFPAAGGRAAGWQVSEDDTVIMEGGDYFVVLRPGAFESPQRGGNLQTNVWRIRTLLFMRFAEYHTIWNDYRKFRAAILNLRDSSPLRSHGIQQQDFIALDDAGYLRDDAGNYVGFIQQTLECVITQRAIIPRAI